MNSPDPVLSAALANAHRWARAIKTSNSLKEVAGSEGQNEALVRTRIPSPSCHPKSSAPSSMVPNPLT